MNIVLTIVCHEFNPLGAILNCLLWGAVFFTMFTLKYLLYDLPKRKYRQKQYNKRFPSTSKYVTKDMFWSGDLVELRDGRCFHYKFFDGGAKKHILTPKDEPQREMRATPERIQELTKRISCDFGIKWEASE